MITPGSTLFDRFEVVRPRQASPFVSSSETRIETYDGVDRFTNEPVMLKAFPIPEDPALALLASALWDREVRAAHLATSSPRGKSLLRLIDARRDSERSILLIVSEGTPSTLLDELQTNPLPPLFRIEGRAQLWHALADLSDGIQALHAAGLIHRAISSATVFVSQSENRPLLLLGDYSWTVYLHGISQMASEQGETAPALNSLSTTVYTPPEGVLGGAGRVESFRSDMFSFGVLIADCLLGRLPPRDPSDADWLTKLRKRVADAPNLSSEATLLLHKLLSESPSRRPSAAETVELIRTIAGTASKTLPPPPHAPLTVAIDFRPESKIWTDLSKWMSVEGIGANQSEFLETEFNGAPVYVQAERTGSLWIRGNSGAPYGLNPYFDRQNNRYNDSVAGVIPLAFVPVQEAPPLFNLGRGIKQTPYPRQVPSGPSWAPYFAIARAQGKTTSQAGPRELFVKRLRLTLEAEKELLSRTIYHYKVTQPVAINGKRREVEIQLDPNEPDPEYDTRRRPSVETWFRTQFVDEIPEVELSDTSRVEARMLPTRKWRVQTLEGENRLALEAPRSGNAPPQAGWARPWDLRFEVPLLARKRKVVDQVEVDEYLLDAVTEPGRVSIFHGARKEEGLVAEILGSRPLFLVQGPPGTGKTYWASRTIEALLKQDETARILVSAQAHKPLDHLMDQVQQSLKAAGFSTAPILLRLSPKFERPEGETEGKPSDLDQVTRDVLGRASQWTPHVRSWEKLAEEWRELVKQQLADPSPAWERLLQGSANVVFVTSTSSSLKDLERTAPFDFVIIEEAGKAYGPELLPPMRLGRRWLLIGDQQQLPPFQHDEMLNAVRRCLERDQEFKEYGEKLRAQFSGDLDSELRFFGNLFDRARQAPYLFKPKSVEPPARRLSEQWRMPSLLSEFTSTIFYDEPFKVRTTPKPLPFSSPPFLAASPLVWVSTPYCASPDRRAEEHVAPGGGFFNPYEIRVIDKLLRTVGPGPLPPSRSLVVLSPYASQVHNLKRSLSKSYRNLPGFDPYQDIHTVDSFQGREADVVVVSLVRNNDREQLHTALGFLTKEERMNVLLSRASSQLVIVGCLSLLETFASSAEMGKLRKVPAFIRKRGVVTPAGALMSDVRR